ncbi:MAG: hypothetical protein NZM94_16260 [Roseiflexus sp.]|nr:hypothetical protein [Roseiflexus sp.]
MTDSLNAPPSSNRNRNLIIGVIAGIIVLCCCCSIVVSLPVLWYCGDWLVGAAPGCQFP